MILKDYIDYIKNIKRYSKNTIRIYLDVLNEYVLYTCEKNEDSCIINSLNITSVRNYEVYLLDDRKESSRTVNLHLSVLSGFAKYLISKDLLHSNPIRLVSRPKIKKRLPEFYRLDAMNRYFSETEGLISEENLSLQLGDDKVSRNIYKSRLNRIIISLLYQTAMRRSELIGLNISSVNFNRKIIRVLGKGEKIREIPISTSLCNEISLYLQSANILIGKNRLPEEPLLITVGGKRLYPVFVDKVVKKELGALPDFTGRKSPHVLRHTLATELLNDGADLNSIKEFLGHSSLAATQVYTHNSIEKLKNVYTNAHPRAKIGGKNGD